MDPGDLPTLSIVTPSFNQARFVGETLRSVLEQRYPRLEYIVIDGGSTDGSAAIIEGYAGQLAYWCSEPDRGQVHAINKGLARATGEIVAFLNSDDVYLPGALAAVARHFTAHPEDEWVCGDTILFGEGHPTRTVPTEVPDGVGALLGWRYKAPQPGMFWRRRLLERGFDERWRYCFDHALYVELYLEGHRFRHLPVPVAGYRLHRESKTVAESEGFEREFDAIAEACEPRLPWAVRQRSRSVRAVRRSCRASAEGRRATALRDLLAGALRWPPEVARRPFWGGLRRAVWPGPASSGQG